LKAFNFHESIPFSDYGVPICDDEQVEFAFHDFFIKNSQKIGVGIDYLKLCATQGISSPSLFKSNLSYIQRSKGVMEIDFNELISTKYIIMYFLPHLEENYEKNFHLSGCLVLL
jgi:hypothetical protein